MPSVTNTLLAAGLAALAQAYTQPKGDPTWGSLLTPDGSSNVVRGGQIAVTWQVPDGYPAGRTVSLVLCKGPGANCQIQPNAIVEGLPAEQKSYQWSVPCDLTPGVASTATGYGMLVIVDQTGEYQYSTQFSVQEGSTCGAYTSTTSQSGSGSGYPTSSTTTTASHSGSDWQSWTSTTSGSGPIYTTTKYANTTTSAGPSYTQPTLITTSNAAQTTTTASQSSSFTGAAARATGAVGAIFAAGVALLAL